MDTTEAQPTLLNRTPDPKPGKKKFIKGLAVVFVFFIIVLILVVFRTSEHPDVRNERLVESHMAQLDEFKAAPVETRLIHGMATSEVERCEGGYCLQVKEDGNLVVIRFAEDPEMFEYQQVVGLTVDATCMPDGSYCAVEGPARVILTDLSAPMEVAE